MTNSGSGDVEIKASMTASRRGSGATFHNRAPGSAKRCVSDNWMKYGLRSTLQFGFGEQRRRFLWSDIESDPYHTFLTLPRRHPAGFEATFDANAGGGNEAFLH